MTPGRHELESQKQNKSGGATTDAPLPDGYSITELGPLPEEWRVVRLREVAIVKSGGSAPQGEIYFLGGKHPFVRVQHLDVDTDHVQHWDLITDEAVQRYHLQKFPAGTIVFPKSGASIRLEKRAMLLVDSYIVSHLCAVLPKVDAIERLFLFYSLKAMRLSEDKADGYPVLNLSEIREVSIPLPSLPEQRAIAHVLRAVQRAREATEGVIAALRELKKSLMRHLFTYGPVLVNATDGVILQETEIGQIPTYWQIVPFGQTILRQRIRVGKVKQQLYKSIGRFPIVDQGQTIIAGYWDNARDVYQGPLPVIIFGDHTRIFKYVDFPFVCGADGTKVLLPDTKNFDSMFLFYAYTRLNIPSRGYNRHFLLLKEQKIPLPPPPEQHEIAHILQTVDRKIEVEEQRKAALEALFKTLLHDLMTARRRLPAEFVTQFEKESEETS